MEGKRIKILISEPWDFESKSGKNILVAKIERTANKWQEKEFWLIKTDEKIEIEDTKSHWFLITNRHKGYNLQMAVEDSNVAINLMILPENYGFAPFDEQIKHVKLALIGSINSIE